MLALLVGCAPHPAARSVPAPALAVTPTSAPSGPKLAVPGPPSERVAFAGAVPTPPIISPAAAGGDDCRAAGQDWVEAARAASAPLDGLRECLAAATPPCAVDMAAVRSTLAELAVHEERLRWLCGGGR